MNNDEIDKLIGADGYLYQLHLPDGRIIPHRAKDLIPTGTTLQVGDSAVEVRAVLHQRDREIFARATYVRQRIPAIPEPVAPRPPVTKFVFTYEIVHSSQVHYGAKPETPWAIIARGTARLPADPGEVPAELVSLVNKLNAVVGDAGIGDLARHRWALVLNESPGKGYDTEAKQFFDVRRLDAVGSGSRRAISRRQILADSPALAAWLDQENGTSGPVERTPAEREADEQRRREAEAKAEADATAQRAAAHVRERREEAIRFALVALDADDRQRAAALLNALAIVHAEPGVIPLLAAEDPAEVTGIGD